MQNKIQSAGRRSLSSGASRTRVELGRFVESRRAQTLRVEEIVGLASSALLLLFTVFSFLYFVAPARSRLTELEVESSRLEAQLRDSAGGEAASEQASVEDIVASLGTFESNHLASRNEGRTAVIKELNDLIRRNNLRITTGLGFASLEATAKAGQESIASVSVARDAKLETIFPGYQFNLTVEGTYPNLRRFISDIEASNKFLIVHGIELEGVTDKSAASPSTGTSSGALVSLRLTAVTYFRRDTSMGGTPDEALSVSPATSSGGR